MTADYNGRLCAKFTENKTCLNKYNCDTKNHFFFYNIGSGYMVILQKNKRTKGYHIIKSSLFVDGHYLHTTMRSL